MAPAIQRTARWTWGASLESRREAADQRFDRGARTELGRLPV